MNYQSRKPLEVVDPALIKEEGQKPPVVITEEERQRMERIKSALNRSARERRMATHR